MNPNHKLMKRLDRLEVAIEALCQAERARRMSNGTATRAELREHWDADRSHDDVRRMVGNRARRIQNGAHPDFENGLDLVALVVNAGTESDAIKARAKLEHWAKPCTSASSSKERSYWYAGNLLLFVLEDYEAELRADLTPPSQATTLKTAGAQTGPDRTRQP